MFHCFFDIFLFGTHEIVILINTHFLVPKTHTFLEFLKHIIMVLVYVLLFIYTLHPSYNNNRIQ